MGRWILFACAAAVATTVLAGCGAAPSLVEPRAWDFKHDLPGAPPTGFVVPQTPTGEAAGDWRISADRRAPSPTFVIRQMATHQRGTHYNLCVADAPPIDDFRLRVAVRSHPDAKRDATVAARKRRDELRQKQEGAGSLTRPELRELDRLLTDHPLPDGDVTAPEDLGGGPLFRYLDAGNYYVVRWDPLEKNLRLDKVVDGERTELASVDIETERNDTLWRTIVVAARGSRIAVAFEGEPKIDFTDPARTFKRGKVGLWTKADAATAFDDLRVEPLGPRDDGAPVAR